MASNMEHLITVIIPMFNESHNIGKCMDILRSQTEQNFTAIFIDDGSTDNTVELLKENIKQNPVKFQYEILQQSNQGAAQARETGIHACQTEYILILDCDDRISPDAIELHHQSIAQYHPDIIMPHVRVQNRDNSYRDFHFFDDTINHNGLICLEHSLNRWEVHGWVCAKKTIFLKSYEIYRQYNPNDENYMNNDEVLVRLHFYNSQKVIKNDAVYYYENNEKSTTKRINPNRYLMAKNVMILYKLFGKGYGKTSIKTQEEYINVLWSLIQYLRKNKKELPNSDLWIAQIKDMYSFIQPDLKDFKLSSFKIWSRFWLSRIFMLFL